jgi:hypothetical protein
MLLSSHLPWFDHPNNTTTTLVLLTAGNKFQRCGGLQWYEVYTRVNENPSTGWYVRSTRRQTHRHDSTKCIFFLIKQEKWAKQVLYGKWKEQSNSLCPLNPLAWLLYSISCKIVAVELNRYRRFYWIACRSQYYLNCSTLPLSGDGKLLLHDMLSDFLLFYIHASFRAAVCTKKLTLCAKKPKV